VSAEHGTHVRRLNWGCGEHPEPGWLNSDLKDGPGIELSCDIRDGLAIDEGSVDYAVSVHALNMIPYPELLPVLRELRRVLKPDGVLRLVLPDLDKAIAAYLAGDPGHFLIPDEHEWTLGGKMVTYLVWYGWSVTPFTGEFIIDLLHRADFASVVTCEYRQTASGRPGIVDLDSRQHESLFVEAYRSNGSR